MQIAVIEILRYAQNDKNNGFASSRMTKARKKWAPLRKGSRTFVFKTLCKKFIIKVESLQFLQLWHSLHRVFRRYHLQVQAEHAYGQDCVHGTMS